MPPLGVRQGMERIKISTVVCSGSDWIQPGLASICMNVFSEEVVGGRWGDSSGPSDTVSVMNDFSRQRRIATFLREKRRGDNINLDYQFLFQFM